MSVNQTLPLNSGECGFCHTPAHMGRPTTGSRGDPGMGARHGTSTPSRQNTVRPPPCSPGGLSGPWGLCLSWLPHPTIPSRTIRGKPTRRDPHKAQQKAPGKALCRTRGPQSKAASRHQRRRNQHTAPNQNWVVPLRQHTREHESLAQVAQFIAVCSRSKLVCRGTSTHRRCTPIYTRWALKW